MSAKRWVLVVAAGWIAIVSVLHLWLNWRVFDATQPHLGDDARFRVGFLPVT